MLPLVRPFQPDFRKVWNYYRKSVFSGTLTNFGPNHQELLKRLDLKFNRHSVVSKSGTDAIKLALQVCFNKGARIALPDYTHIGTINAVISAGMNPILVGCKKETWTIDEDILEPNFEKFDGFICVSPFGYEVDFDVYDNLAKRIDRPVIYDLAGGYGMEINTEYPVCFSLHATKNFSAGEGGITLFSNKDDAYRAERLSVFSIYPEYGSVSIDLEGYNCKPDEIHCAIVLAMLDIEARIKTKITKKRNLISFYQQELDGICLKHDRHIKGAPSLAVLAGLDFEKIKKIASDLKINCKPYFPLLTELFPDLPWFSKSPSYFKKCIAFPSDVSFEEAVRVVKMIKQAYKS